MGQEASYLFLLILKPLPYKTGDGLLGEMNNPVADYLMLASE